MESHEANMMVPRVAKVRSALRLLHSISYLGGVVDYCVDPKSGVYSGFVQGLTLKTVDHNRPSGLPDA